MLVRLAKAVHAQTERRLHPNTILLPHCSKEIIADPAHLACATYDVSRIVQSSCVDNLIVMRGEGDAVCTTGRLQPLKAGAAREFAARR